MAVRKTSASKAKAAKPVASITTVLTTTELIRAKLITADLITKTSTTSPATTLPIDLPIQAFTSALAWERWLAANQDRKGLWLKIAKKDSGIATVSYAQALDIALCHGWIDGQKRSCDAQYFLQRFTPRRPKSLWSKINIGKVEQLMLEQRIQPSGLREIEAAKADGRWDAAYDGASTMQVPDALFAALKKNKPARIFFESLDKTNRYAVCWRVQTAKTPEICAARVSKLIEMLANGQKIHH